MNPSYDNPVEHIPADMMPRYERTWKTDREREAEKMGKSTVRAEGPVGFILAVIGILLVLVSFLSWFFISGN
jgi:hypothetical protein